VEDNFKNKKEDDESNSKADSGGSEILITEDSFENVRRFSNLKELFEKFKAYGDPVLYYKNETGEIEISDSQVDFDDDLDDESQSIKIEK
jgi:hypothetical protein